MNMLLLALDPITLSVLLGTVATACGLGSWFAMAGYKVFQKSYEKISDAEILAIAQRLGTLTSGRLASNSVLSKNEAYWRLAMLYSKGLFKVLYDESYITGYYVLKENLNFDLKLPENQPITEESMIWLAKQYNGYMSVAILVAATNMSAEDAKSEMVRFKDKGILMTKYNSNFELSYVLSKDLPVHTHNIQAPVNQTLTPPHTSPSKQKISDPEVIELAVKSKGKITVASLCLKKTISVEESQKILDDLYKKGIFDLKVSENGTIEYWLNDTTLLEE